MTNPTTPFSWQMPTSTDLVTDLPADFETFGQAVATSMADLLGGTTGQILSKASNTNMDFTWITNDVGDITAVTAGTGISGGGTSGAVTITNSMATEIAAKGDLIVGTGAATFDNLTAGSNFAFLQTDSSTATGLAWDISAFTSYTPTVTAASGSFTTVSATGSYKRVGKICFVYNKITITTNGTATAAVLATLPFSGTSKSYSGVFRENNLTGNIGIIQTDATQTIWRKYDNNYPGGTGAVLEGSYFYEVA
jgi:predicted secreted protein